MLVTINTDASVVEGYGGYAFYIVCNQGKIQKAGKIKSNSVTIVEAELSAIANAIYTLLHSKFTGITKVVINTDSKSSIQSLSRLSAINKKQKHYAVADETLFNMMDLCVKMGFKIRDVKTFFDFRHVKAHTGIKDARSWVNEWCDVNARSYAREQYRSANPKKNKNEK